MNIKFSKINILFSKRYEQFFTYFLEKTPEKIVAKIKVIKINFAAIVFTLDLKIILKIIGMISEICSQNSTQFKKPKFNGMAI